MAVVGCYSLDLYCDTGGDVYGGNCPHRPVLNSVFAQYHGPTEGACMKQARLGGWKFNRDRSKAYCPACSRLPQGRNPER